MFPWSACLPIPPGILQTRNKRSSPTSTTLELKRLTYFFRDRGLRYPACLGLTPRRGRTSNSNAHSTQPKTKGGSCVRMSCVKMVPFDACSSLSEMQSKYALSSTCQACLTTANGTIRCPGTRWTRFRSPEKPGYPVASPSPTTRIGRVPVRGGYRAGSTPTLLSL